MPDWLATLLDSSTVSALLQIGLIALLTVAALLGLRLLARRFERRLGATTFDVERRDRLNTLVQVGRDAASVVILLIAALMILHELDINIAPLLASAGLAGLALTLGAQRLIQDFVGGALILIENQFTDGDVIEVGGVEGVVERITLRATYLRDEEDRLQIVPNGDIRTVSNLTVGWARATVDVNVDYQSDLSKVTQALESAAHRAQADDAITGDLLDRPQVQGWIDFKDWTVQVRLTAKTVPGKQWSVAMVLRKYAVEALKSEDVQAALLK